MIAAQASARQLQLRLEEQGQEGERERTRHAEEEARLARQAGEAQHRADALAEEVSEGVG